jgi:acetolactate synthase-1/3 small subunit
VTHTLSVLVENRPGALARVSNMFARRGFNIESLAVGPTERPNVSRITLRVDCAQESIEQIEKQMHKLVNVLRVNELEPGEAIERELALLKVNAPAERRGELLALAEVFSARVADLGPNAIIFEVARPERACAHRPHRPRPGVHGARAQTSTRTPLRKGTSWQRSTAKATSSS